MPFVIALDNRGTLFGDGPVDAKVRREAATTGMVPEEAEIGTFVNGEQPTIEALKRLKALGVKIVLTTGDGKRHIDQAFQVLHGYNAQTNLIDQVYNWEGYKSNGFNATPHVRKDQSSGKNELFESIMSDFRAGKDELFIFDDGPEVVQKAQRAQYPNVYQIINESDLLTFLTQVEQHVKKAKPTQSSAVFSSADGKRIENEPQHAGSGSATGDEPTKNGSSVARWGGLAVLTGLLALAWRNKFIPQLSARGWVAAGGALLLTGFAIFRKRTSRTAGADTAQARNDGARPAHSQ